MHNSKKSSTFAPDFEKTSSEKLVASRIEEESRSPNAAERQSMRQAHSDEGEMAEWSIAAVLKTVELRGSGGSNPSLSAINAENQQIIKQTPNFTPKNVKLGVFILFKTNHIRSENNLIKNRTNEKNNQFIFRKISYLCSK